MTFTAFKAPTTITARDLLASPPPDRLTILTPWLKERDAVMLHAPTGAGKSQVAMSTALAVATGGSVFGWKAPQALPVLFVDGEMDRSDLVERLRLLMPTINPPVQSESLSSFHILARDMHTPDAEFPDIGKEPPDGAKSDKDGHKVILAKVKETGARFVVLDNLSTLATVEDENSASAVKRPMDLIQKLRQAGCTTLMIHHSGKSKSKSDGKGETSPRYRGSSNITTTFSWIISLEPHKDRIGNGLDVFTRWEKTRGKLSEATESQRWRLVTGDAGTAEWVCAVDLTMKAYELKKAIKAAANSGNATSLRQIFKKLEWPKSTGDGIAQKLYVLEGGLSKQEVERLLKQAKVAAKLPTDLDDDAETPDESSDF